MRLSEMPVAVVAWVQEGCPACADYVPRLVEVAKRYEHCIPTLVIDCGQYSKAADFYRVANTPETMIIRWGRKTLTQLDGDAPTEHIETLYQRAASYGASREMP